MKLTITFDEHARRTHPEICSLFTASKTLEELARRAEQKNLKVSNSLSTSIEGTPLRVLIDIDGDIKGDTSILIVTQLMDIVYQPLSNTPIRFNMSAIANEENGTNSYLIDITDNTPE